MMPPSNRPLRADFDPHSEEAIAAHPNRYGKEAYTCAHDRRFAQFASEINPDATFDYLHHSEEFICKQCNVPVTEGAQALRWIDSSSESVEKWKALKAAYDAWLEKQNTGA